MPKAGGKRKRSESVATAPKPPLPPDDREDEEDARFLDQLLQELHADDGDDANEDAMFLDQILREMQDDGEDGGDAKDDLNRFLQAGEDEKDDDAMILEQFLQQSEEELSFVSEPPPPLLNNKSKPDELLPPAAKKARKNDPVRIPIADTVLPGADYSKGLLQVPPDARKIAAHITPVPRHVVPPRAEHTFQTLIPPALKPLTTTDLLIEHASWKDDVSPEAVLRLHYAEWLFERVIEVDNNPQATADERRAVALFKATDRESFDRAVRGERLLPSTEEPRLLQAASLKLIDPFLGLIQEQRPPPPPPRTAATAALKLKQLLQHDFHQKQEAALLSYYVDDPEPDPDLPFGLPPSAYRHFHSDDVSKQRQNYVHRLDWLRDAGENVQRVEIEMILREHLDRYRQPLSSFPKPERRRGCVRGAACAVYDLARKENRPLWAYTLAEFLLPSGEREMQKAMLSGNQTRIDAWFAAHPTPGPCCECELKSYTNSFYFNNLSRKPPAHPINRFKVKVGEGSYARDVCLPEEIAGLRTGIEGHVPAWDAKYRQFDPQGNGTAILREVNVDFHFSLSQMNCVLGVRKARPLAEANGARFLPLKLNAFALPSAREPPPLLPWSRYVDSLPQPLLADRAFLQQQQATPGALPSRVPAIWLRRHILTTTTTIDDDDETSFVPLVQTHLERYTPLPLLHGLAALFQVPVSDLGEQCLLPLARGSLTTFEQSVRLALSNTYNNTALLTGPLQLLFAPPQERAWAAPLFGCKNEHACLVRPPGWSVETAWQGPWKLYTVCLWRIAVSILLEHVLRPWALSEAEHQQHPEATTQARYGDMNTAFMDTHLDFLTVLSALLEQGQKEEGRGQDEWWLFMGEGRPEPRFSHLYPQATRVCCADELPDLTPLLLSTNLWCDGTSKKQGGGGSTMRHMLIQIFMKTKAHVCMMRSNDNIVLRAMKNYAAIQHLVTLILRCALLGNFPGAAGRPPLHARLRINATFAPRTALFACVPLLLVLFFFF